MKFRYNNTFILSRFTFHYQDKFYDFNGMICLNFDGEVLNIGFKIKDEEWATSYKPFVFKDMFLIKFRKFSEKIHENLVSKEYMNCICTNSSHLNWITGYNGYILCGSCNGKITI